MAHSRVLADSCEQWPGLQIRDRVAGHHGMPFLLNPHRWRFPQVQVPFYVIADEYWLVRFATADNALLSGALFDLGRIFAVL